MIPFLTHPETFRPVRIPAQQSPSCAPIRGRVAVPSRAIAPACLFFSEQTRRRCLRFPAMVPRTAAKMSRPAPPYPRLVRHIVGKGAK